MPAADDLISGLTPGLIWASQNASDLAVHEYWRPLEALYPSAQTFSRVPPLISTTATAAMASGTLYLFGGVVLRPDIQITGAHFWATAAAVAPTNYWACLVDARDRTVLAKSADKLNEAWAINTKKSFVFTGYTPDEMVPAYIGLMQAAGTPAIVHGVNCGAATRPNGEAPYLGASSDVGLTTPATLGATAAALTAFNGLAYTYLT